jgi:phosphoribosylformylglycinamidine cyclo-ligase
MITRGLPEKSLTLPRAARRLNPILPMPSPSRPLSYLEAGVDIDAGDRLVENIKPYAKRTLRPEVLAGIGGFGALIELPKRFREPVLVAGTDGVGTKLKLGFALAKHDTIGIDLVAMSVNDILVQGAEPLFFLDYYVCERLEVDVATEVIKGIARGCEIAGCALIGGETAEHPRAFIPGEYDLAGFAVGVVEKSKAIDGTTIAAGDVLIGLASSGPHSNGFSLIRRIVETSGADLNRAADGVVGATLGAALLEPTRIYVKPILALLTQIEIKGMAHITGGGLTENTHRMFGPGLAARIDSTLWPRPAIFDWLQRTGNVASAEMVRVFNCGIGMVLVVDRSAAQAAIDRLTSLGESAYLIGTVERRTSGAPGTIVV